MNRILYFLFIVGCCSCTGSNETEKYQGTRDKVIHVRDKVEEIKIEDPLIGSYALVHVMDEYLFIRDVRPFDKYIHLFDKNNFGYISSMAKRGQGPEEITNMGSINIDEAKRKFYVTDHGKQKVLSYDLDSVLTYASSYTPRVKMGIDEFLFPDYYQILNDSISICRIIQPIGSNNFKPTVGKMNMNTGEIELMKYEHPKIIGRKRISVVASIEHGIYVEYYHNHDLMTICNLDGDLICNIYGPDWIDGSEREGVYYSYYGGMIFCGDKIYAAYSGERSITEKGQASWPTKLLVFDLQGNYIQTLETGLHISNFCYDKENNRIILSLNDDIQFGYLPLDGF
ncbi:MAG: 6-bladed beta-propeller [Clostridiales bacterium]|jgi:hypothetical protein|nr:6-bladed beta-propeller [Clostridiales bacterium]